MTYFRKRFPCVRHAGPVVTYSPEYKSKIIMSSKISIKSLSYAELSERLAATGLKGYRIDQVFDWLYRKRASSFDAMTNLPKEERQLLDSLFSLALVPVLRSEQSSDGTRKFLFGLDDGQSVESVLIPDEDRLTLCISSQVGCSQACRFCLTGASGFTRNLSSGEILDQIITVERLLSEGGPQDDRRAAEHQADEKTQDGNVDRRITNIVLMGMGEPLANFAEVKKALEIMLSGQGMGISGRRVTLSTAGLVPEIEKLGRTGLRVGLAVSLNASTDEVRDEVMPVNRRYPLTELLGACRAYPLEPRRRITFEYVLLKNVNDSPEDARRVAKLLRGIPCKVNLIPVNPFPGSAYERPTDDAVRRFQQVLLDRHIAAPVRSSRGRDISAACGQLRGHASSPARLE